MDENQEIARELGVRLLLWGVVNAVFGSLMLVHTSALLRGIAVQALLWGVIDSVIAIFTLNRQSNQPAMKLARILLVNVGLDVIYQVVGVNLIVLFPHDPFVSGNGMGIMIQGTFLLALDLFYYRKMRGLVSTDTVL